MWKFTCFGHFFALKHLKRPRCNNEGNLHENSFEEQLEYSILQQLFYHVKAQSIPESRFGRIERTSCRQRILLVLGILLFIVASLFLFCQEQVTKFFLVPADFLKSTSVVTIQQPQVSKASSCT